MEEGAQDGPADSPARTDPLQQKADAEDHEQDDAHAGDQIDDVYHGAKFLETGCLPCPKVRGDSCLQVPSQGSALR